MAPILLVEIISALVGLVCLGALTVRFICVRLTARKVAVLEGSAPGDMPPEESASLPQPRYTGRAPRSMHRARMLERTRAAGQPLPASFFVP